MAKYKYYSYDQQLMIAVTLENQVLPDTFEYTLNHVIDNLDLSVFDKNYRNDKTGALAYDPAILLKSLMIKQIRFLPGSIPMKTRWEYRINRL